MVLDLSLAEKDRKHQPPFLSGSRYLLPPAVFE